MPTKSPVRTVKRYYKILKKGKSCNGGRYTWSLPRQVKDKWIPGEWHRMKRGTYLAMCQRGFHLAKKPFGNWFSSSNCTAYHAEYETAGMLSDHSKICVSAVRLLRPVNLPSWMKEINKMMTFIKRKMHLLRPSIVPSHRFNLWQMESQVPSDCIGAVRAARDAINEMNLRWNTRQLLILCLLLTYQHAKRQPINPRHLRFAKRELKKLGLI